MQGPATSAAASVAVGIGIIARTPSWRRGLLLLSALLGLAVACLALRGEEGVLNGMMLSVGGANANGSSGRSRSGRNKQGDGGNNTKRLNAKMRGAQSTEVKAREARMATYDDDDDDSTERSGDEPREDSQGDDGHSTGRSVFESSEDSEGDGGDDDDSGEKEAEREDVEKEEKPPGITHEQLLAQLRKDIGVKRPEGETQEEQPKYDPIPDDGMTTPIDANANTIGASEGPRPYYLVYSSDEEQRPGVEASIRSVQAHASGPVEFLFVGDRPLTDLPDTVRVHFRQLSEVAEQYNLSDFENDRFQRHGKNAGLNTNHANYVRFVMHELLPRQAGKAMWIDADTIVECDVIQLMRDALTNPRQPKNTIAAVPREGVINGLTRRGRNYSSDVTVSFNAGMYIVNLDRWREQHMTELIRRIAGVNRQYGLYLKGSQPPLALVVGENFEHLPQSWNVKMVDLDPRDDAGGASVRAKREEWLCLMHWSGPNKPWLHGHEDKIHPEYWLTWGNPVEPEDLDE